MPFETLKRSTRKGRIASSIPTGTIRGNAVYFNRAASILMGVGAGVRDHVVVKVDRESRLIGFLITDGGLDARKLTPGRAGTTLSSGRAILAAFGGWLTGAPAPVLYLKRTGAPDFFTAKMPTAPKFETVKKGE